MPTALQFAFQMLVILQVRSKYVQDYCNEDVYSKT